MSDYPRAVGTEWETLTEPDVRHLGSYSLTTEMHPYKRVLTRWRVVAHHLNAGGGYHETHEAVHQAITPLRLVYIPRYRAWGFEPIPPEALRYSWGSEAWRVINDTGDVFEEDT